MHPSQPQPTEYPQCPDHGEAVPRGTVCQQCEREAMEAKGHRRPKVGSEGPRWVYQGASEGGY